MNDHYFDRGENINQGYRRNIQESQDEVLNAAIDIYEGAGRRMGYSQRYPFDPSLTAELLKELRELRKNRRG